MKEFTRNEIAMFKKVADLVMPFQKKVDKAKEKMAKLQAEIDENQAWIDRQEAIVVEKTGYHVLDLFYLKETPTNRLNAKGNTVVDKSWQPKYEHILPENEDEAPDNQEVVNVPESPVAGSDFDLDANPEYISASPEEVASIVAASVDAVKSDEVDE